MVNGKTKKYVDANDISILEVVRKYHGEPESLLKESTGIKINCPIHSDSSPSFKIYEESNTFYCFGCGAAGHTLDLVRMMKGLGTNEEAEELLMKDFDIDEDAIPTVEGLCEMKGLDINVVTRLGWRDKAEGVLIPYNGSIPEQRSVDGVTHRIRRKYKGSPKYTKDGKNINIPYGLDLLDTYKEDTIYLTEGETDMVTLYQAGFQALGIPGASMYREEYNVHLLRFSNIVVVLDSDTAGDGFLHTILDKLGEDRVRVFFKEMPRGIKDVNTFHCTKCLGDIDRFRENFRRLPTVPATLTGVKALFDINPALVVTRELISSYTKHILRGDKIEADKFVKFVYDLTGKEQGVTKSTLNSIIKDTLRVMTEETAEMQELVGTLSDDTGDFIQERDGVYVIKKITMQGIVLEPFTSFTIKVKGGYEMEDGECKAIWEVTNTDDEKIEVLVGIEERTSSVMLQKQLNKYENFMYRVPSFSGFHNLFMNYIEKQSPHTFMKQVPCVGHYKNVWLFDGIGIDSRGEIVQYNNERNGYTLDGHGYCIPKDSIPRGMYVNKVHMPMPTEISKEEVEDLLRLLEKNQGSKIAWVLLGWIGACFIKDIIQERGWGMPIAYVTGNAQSGKTTLATWILKTVGYMTASAYGARSSVVGINLISTVYRNLPIWFDDIRNLGEEGIWNTLILGFYENAATVKGNKDGGLASQKPFESGLLITSEFFVKSPAAASRCIRLEADDTLQDRTIYTEVAKKAEGLLPYIGINAIIRRQKEVLDFKKELDEARALLVSKGLKERYAQSYATVLVGFKLLFGHMFNENSDIYRELKDYIVITTAEVEQEDESNNYALGILKDLAGMANDPIYKNQFKSGDQWLVRDNKLIMFTDTLYETWRRYKGINNTGDYNTRREFVSQLRRTKYSKRNKTGTVSFNGKNKTAIVIDLDMLREAKDVELQTIPDAFISEDVSDFL